MTQLIGAVVSPLPPGTLPDLRPLHGRYARLDALNPARHGGQLWNAINGKDEGLWTYLVSGPFENEEVFQHWLEARAPSRDPWFYAFVKRDTGHALGMGAFMRADPVNGVIEIGHIWFTKELQHTREATEVIYLMMRHGFDDLGVRRFEWKCNALNEPSMRAAKRFGFTYEGTFRQHMIARGHNRDTAWFSIIDSEWPRIKAGFEKWLDPANFDENGKQKAKLQVG